MRSLPKAGAVAAHKVRHHQVEPLRGELGLGAGDEVVGLGGEAHQHGTLALPRMAAFRERGQHVGGALQCD